MATQELTSALVSAEKYDVLEVIGRGSFGIIRKVRRKSDGHILCRKEIAYQKMAAKEREQLAAEFSILSSLHHPYIVQYYHREHLKMTQELYIYMEYCGGGDLGSVIKNLKATGEYATEEFVWRVFAQIVEALYRCHYGAAAPEAGSDLARASRELKRQVTTGGPLKGKAESVMILHRDLKPENIFLGEDQSVKLGDFGLSKQMQSHDFASTYVGTPFYMSPEICAAERYTSHSDIWSLGCIMYELCTREPPFNAKTHIQLVQRIRKGEFKDLPDCYSKDLKNVIASCLKVNPLHRPDTASLLTVPYVWIARKGREMVEFGKILKTKEELAVQKLRHAEERLAAVEADRAKMKAEIDASIRREWELKARLEIDRQVATELERLRRKFNLEVEEKVQHIMAKQQNQKGSVEQRALKEISNPPAATKENQEPNPFSSVSVSGEDDFPSTTDITDLSSLSLESPSSSPTKPAQTKKSSKTPFTRSKTTFESPADVQMNEASPMSISSLALSPRRNANAQAQAAAHAGNKNIFAEASVKQKVAAAKWEPTVAYTSDSEDEDGFPDLPSPTRPKSNQADPFKRPGMASRQHTTATMQNLNAKPTLFPSVSSKGAAIRAAAATAIQSNIPSTQTMPDLRQEATGVHTLRKSPSRRLSKIPSSTTLSAVSEAGSPTRLPSKQQQATSFAMRAAEADKVGQRNTIGGKTLVELAHARAGGRPSSADAKSGSGVKVATAVSAKDEVPIWDPERDEMPSPFLVRTRAIRGLR